MFLRKIITELNNNDSKPTNTTYCVPSSDMNNPTAAAPIVVPKLTVVKNSPLAKSGDSGAEDMIQYSSLDLQTGALAEVLRHLFFYGTKKR